MLYWIWRLLWWPPQHLWGTSRLRQAKDIRELDQRLGLLEISFKQLRGRLTGALRRGEVVADPDPEPELELADLDDSRALGAATRWGKAEL